MSQPAWIVSFPKSGRTWLRVMLGKALCEEFNLDDATLLNLDDIGSQIGLGKLRLSHDESEIKDGQPVDQMETSKARYAGSTVVLIVRDPRDVMVSCYFQATKRRHVFDGPLESFIRDERYGIRKCAAFHRIWSENRHVPQRFHLVRYEEMRRDPGGALRSVLATLGIPELSATVIEHAVSFGAFDNMRQLEASGYFDDKILRPGNAADPESFKVRRGETGGYRNYVSEATASYMRRVMAEEGGRFYAPYLDSAETS